MSNCLPFLKWPGGKRWILPYIEKYINVDEIINYYEPFLGGGAVFFSYNFKTAYLSDNNENLINVYNIVKERPDLIIAKIKNISEDKNTYYKLRSTVFDNDIDKAVQFIYLNRLAFGGMYRVNLNGEFNVPYGENKTTSILWSKDLLINASNKLKNAHLNCSDFQELMRKANDGDLIYCDPPYTVSHNKNGFIKYNQNLFQWEDQVRLAEECILASQKGVKIIVSNAAHESIRKLYMPINPIIVSRFSGISKVSKFRQNVEEYLFLFNFK